MSVLMGWIDIEVKDKSGKVTQRGRHEMRSFLNNFLRVIAGYFNTPGSGAADVPVTIVDPTGSSATIYTEWYGKAAGGLGYLSGGIAMAARAPAGDASYGVVVGSGVASVALDQYKLDTPIPQGTGAGQLDHRDMTVVDMGLDESATPPVYRVRLIRTLSNGSTTPVTINEVGLMARSYWKEGGYLRNDVKYLIARDVLPSSYTVQPGGVATVALTVEVTMG